MNKLDNKSDKSFSQTEIYNKVSAGLAKRYRAEKRFRRLGIVAIAISFAFLVILFTDILVKGIPAFHQTYIQLPVTFDAGLLPERDLERADYQGLVKASCRHLFPNIHGRREKRQLHRLISTEASYQLRLMVLENPKIIGSTMDIWVPADDDLDMLIKGQVGWSADEGCRLSPQQMEWVRKLQQDGRIRQQFNRSFFTAGDSRDPELAGIMGALTGTIFTLLITLLLSFPLGVAAAVYLEEFAPRNRWSDFIEVNINNLAAVPSIIFGLLGLGVFINFFGLPRSAPLLGGLVLSLLTLPTIIIASRAALKSVPPSIRKAALGIGASPIQMVMHHVLPLALPGMLTGTIIGMSRALGETAPLLMIGMVAFIVDIPGSITSPATVLPVQIYLWAGSAERSFTSLTSAAIIILLAFLIAMNATAVILRKRFERRW
jgi:phosphate transport system permease protein